MQCGSENTHLFIYVAAAQKLAAADIGSTKPSSALSISLYHSHVEQLK